MKKYCTIIFSIMLFTAIFHSTECRSQICEGYIPVKPDLRLYYRTVGDGPETIVMFPATGMVVEKFKSIAQNRTFIFVDPRSRGRSERVEDPNRLGIPREIDDLELIRKHFNKQKISIIGWSYWGAVAGLYAAKYPDRIDRLIQVGPMAPAYDIKVPAKIAEETVPVDPEAVKKLQDLYRTGEDKSNPVAFCRAQKAVTMPKYLGDQAALSQIPDKCEYPNEWPQNIGRTLRYVLGSLGNYDWKNEISTLKVPTLVIQGEKDRIVPMEGSRVWAARPDARILIIPGSGHFPFVENPALFFSAVDNFLKESRPD